ncbi:MAG TPA: hypothetical protein VK213_14185 [Bacteroidales bacterium]|nr:hypothetical protein [Bacteroidales bacterium]
MAIFKDEIIDLAIMKDDLYRLSGYHNTSCISIYLPTHRGGVETLNGQDAINLKNQAKDVRNKLIANGLISRDIEGLMNPLTSLVEDPDFWRHQSDGLAIFISEDIFEKFTVPVKFEEQNYVSSEFYVKPLIPLYNNTGTYFLLTLKKEGPKFYEGNRYGIIPVDVEGIIPSRLEDSVGYDFKQKQLQFRTQIGGNKPGSFHGHGESEVKNKNELQTYFRDIDRGIMNLLNKKQDIPLVLCCLDYYYPVYREVCTHKNLYPGFISSNPADLDNLQLHEKACMLLEQYFNSDLSTSRERFLIGLDKGKSSTELKEIVMSAVHGKIDTLFIEKNSDAYGIYDPANGNVYIQEEHTLSNVSLMNLTAKKVFEQGGIVYLLERNEMPDGSSDMNALYRY